MLKPWFSRIAHETLFQDLDTAVQSRFGLRALDDISNKCFLFKARMLERRPFFVLSNLFLDLCTQV